MKEREKWLIAKRTADRPVFVTPMRFRTKSEADREVKRMNRELGKVGSMNEFLVREVGWRRKRWWS